MIDADPAATNLLLYQTADGQSRIDVRLLDETVWLSQAQLAELFQKARTTITEHIQNVFEEGELEANSVCRNFRHTAADGKTYDIQCYNLDVIISVGYRVKSPRGTQFRIWATQRLREYLVKGFILDDARLERGSDYFDELVERVRAIRTSERRFYQKITDIYATSLDYQPENPLTKTFFATVQNKFHFAIHGQTAAEMIASRADAAKPHMGLTSFKGAVIKRADVAIAKNYLAEDEIASLNRIVDQYLSFAEEQAARRKPMHMQDWIDKLHGFLTLNDREILHHAGTVSAGEAERIAVHEFETYRKLEDARLVSDFDRMAQGLVERKNPKGQSSA